MVGKRKNPADAWLPPRVYRGKSSYEYRPKGGGTAVLCKLPEGPETESIKAGVWAAYAKAKDAPVARDDMNRLMDEYHRSQQFLQKSINTKADYLQYSKRIRRVFGHMIPGDIRPPHIRAFMDALSEQGKTVTANRHHSYLSVIFSWGVERAWLDTNPAKQVRKFQEKARTRYIEDWEYDLVLGIAKASSYPYLAPMMEIAYLCRARSIEVRGMRESHILPEGIFLERTKGSQNEITGWSERLRAAVAEARAMHPGAPVVLSRPLFHGKRGAPIPKEAFKTAWGRVMAIAMKNGLLERFTFHDIKARGVTDHADKASGHKSKKMQAVYDRKPGTVTPTR